jgi:quercetin dioxygenase-like cupin family protein
VESRPPVVLPALRPSFVLTRIGDGSWSNGRAGMLYRDLVPDRQGGRVVASHIRLPQGGPVPDYVHYHRVRFQLIYCVSGSARVVYEDQGPPFELAPGDAILQPPEIRHRVLECTPGLEVIEVSCPAEHETLADFELSLPTQAVRPNRTFDGQRFVRHEAARATFAPWRVAGFEARDLGVAAATGSLATAHVVRPTPATAAPQQDPSLEAHGALLFSFVLAGSARLHFGGAGVERVGAGDAFTIPPGHGHALRECASDLELLQLAIDPLRS